MRENERGRETEKTEEKKREKGIVRELGPLSGFGKKERMKPSRFIYFRFSDHCRGGKS